TRATIQLTRSVFFYSSASLDRSQLLTFLTPPNLITHHALDSRSSRTFHIPQKIAAFWACGSVRPTYDHQRQFNQSVNDPIYQHETLILRNPAAAKSSSSEGSLLWCLARR